MSTSVQLGDILEVQNGFAFKSDFFTNNGGIPLVRIRDLPNASTETNYSGEYRPEFLVQPGDFLIGMDGDFRCVRWSGLEGLLNQRVCRLRNFSPRVEPDYIFHAIGRKLDAIHSTTAFVTVKHLSSKQILKIEVPLPPLPEQRRIVDILNRANGIRRLRREAQEKARQVIPALFVEMFGDPQRNSKGWPVETVGEILEAADYGTSQKASENGAGLPVLRMGNVTREGDLNLQSLKYIELSEADAAKYLLREGDILFNRTNSKELVGKTGLWDGRFPAVPASYFIRARARQDRLNPWYLWAFMNSRHMKQRLFETARGAIGQANINAKELRAFPIPVPPLPLQQTFASRVSDIQAMIAQQERMAAASERLVQSLMAAVFG